MRMMCVSIACERAILICFLHALWSVESPLWIAPLTSVRHAGLRTTTSSAITSATRSAPRLRARRASSTRTSASTTAAPSGCVQADCRLATGGLQADYRLNADGAWTGQGRGPAHAEMSMVHPRWLMGVNQPEVRLRPAWPFAAAVVLAWPVAGARTGGLRVA